MHTAGASLNRSYLRPRYGCFRPPCNRAPFVDQETLSFPEVNETIL